MAAVEVWDQRVRLVLRAPQVTMGSMVHMGQMDNPVLSVLQETLETLEMLVQRAHLE
jgi:hypothetical protein